METKILGKITKGTTFNVVGDLLKCTESKDGGLSKDEIKFKDAYDEVCEYVDNNFEVGENLGEISKDDIPKIKRSIYAEVVKNCEYEDKTPEDSCDYDIKNVDVIAGITEKYVNTSTVKATESADGLMNYEYKWRNYEEGSFETKTFKAASDEDALKKVAELEYVAEEVEEGEEITQEVKDNWAAEWDGSESFDDIDFEELFEGIDISGWDYMENLNNTDTDAVVFDMGLEGLEGYGDDDGDYDDYDEEDYDEEDDDDDE